jgi:hypothetical protein
MWLRLWKDEPQNLNHVLSKDCAAEIKTAEIKTCQNLEKPQNLEPAEKTTYTVCSSEFVLNNYKLWKSL